jgi:hypothetical protein
MDRGQPECQGKFVVFKDGKFVGAWDTLNADLGIFMTKMLRAYRRTYDVLARRILVPLVDHRRPGKT